ncbi:MAG TPA: NAD(P)H-dependent glycerol-3-phosphate dehydrogenase [Firmicutes bacterium]|nr:NAD(P)H-dependent glycerol-3-phosphate dehydrogenase [Bacillota bacterium]
MKVGVVGAGGWGTALAKLLTENGHQVMLWAYEQETMAEINQKHTNERFLPGVVLPAELRASTDPAEVVDGAEFVTFVVPSQWVRTTAKQFASHLAPETVVVNAGKGLEIQTLKTLSQVLKEELSALHHEIVVLSGPNHSEEVSRRLPSATVVASPDLKVAEEVQEIFMSPYFRVYTNRDRLGVELGGALKNVFSMAAGICDGLNFGDNTKAALVTRALAEMRRLGVMMGAEPETFSGLSGLGDLFVTAASRHSRNAWAGREIGKGRRLEEILASTPMVVEGVPTTKAAYALSKKFQVELPIVEKMYQVLFEDYPPRQAVEDLMIRERRSETEDIF